MPRPTTALPRLWDAHTHLHLHPNPPLALAAALAAGVTDLCVCATHPGDWAAVLALCAAAPAALVPSLGVHPCHAARAGPPSAWLPALEAALDAAAAAHPRLGIGECGLDFSPRALAANPQALQLAALEAQLALAAARALPVSLHCVRAQPALLAALAARAAAPGGLPRGLLLHSWGGRPADAARLQALGIPCVFSFSGGLVAAAARAVAGGPRTPGCASRDALASWLALPRGACALETDAPDQPFVHCVTPQLRGAWGEAPAAGARPAEAAPPTAAAAAAGAAAAAEPGAGAGSSCCGGPDAGGAAGAGAGDSGAAQHEPNAPEHVALVAAAGALLLARASAARYSSALAQECAAGANARLDALFPWREPCGGP